MARNPFLVLVFESFNMNKYMSLVVLTSFALALAGCSKPASAVDPRLAADMRTITNVIIKNGPIYKKIEAGELGGVVSIPIVIGTNSDQRHYILTWKESKWQISPTNQ